ncbi:hypothetical protein BTVI_39985 [Pitangus sulphuratus]|nr:hypothetical protein BTVI_39985 [Pitangus sulphuratus]
MLKAISTHIEDKKVMRSSWHGFINGQSSLTNPSAIYNETTTWMDEERAVDAFYLNFSKVFDTVSCNIFISKLRKYGLDKWMVMWIENWVNGRS